MKLHYIVAIGNSAGGLDALEKFFRNMKSDSDLSFVLIQHLAPDYKSMMVELLSKHTNMRVKHPDDGEEVQPNTVYIIPPKKNLTIFHRKLLLNDRDSKNTTLNLPIDIFFRSLAYDQKEKAIGIILSGTGTDGTLGSRAIKESGGIILVQAPETAQFNGMPQSAIHTGLADYILAPESMPEKLIQYIRHPYISEKSEGIDKDKKESNLEKILSMLRMKTDIDFSYYKPSTIIRRIERRISINNIESIETYIKYLDHNYQEIHNLYNEFLIGVTRFFRDSEAFDYIEKNVIPEIIQYRLKNAPEDTQIRIWVAGCSTGEEVYSLAMMFYDYLKTKNLNLKVKIFATDVDKKAIEVASNGLYPASIVSDVPPRFLGKYFYKNDDFYQIVKNIREMVVFAQHNLLKDPPFTKLDLISCRNLLIYLKPDIQKKILSMFGFALKIRGFLFLGSSETVGDLYSIFANYENRYKIFYYKGGAKYSHLQPDGISFRKMKRTESAYNYHIYKNAEKIKRDIENRLIEEFVPPSVVVDEELNVINIIGDINDYLQISSGTFTTNLLKMVPNNLSVILSSAIRKAKKQNQKIIYKNIMHTIKNSSLEISFTIEPYLYSDTEETLMIISFLKQVSIDVKKEITEVNINQAAVGKIDELEEELKHSRENLQSTIEELETSNEELQATNEELMSANEELQSTNEELQSVNEELYTVNSEYQNKIEELNNLNDDMNNFLRSSNIGTIFLDKNFLIRRFTPAIKNILPILEQDIGRPIEIFSASFDQVNFIEDSKKVIENFTPTVRVIHVKNEIWYEMHIHPYQTKDSIIEGVIISFVNIHERKEKENKIIEQNYLLETLIETFPVPVFYKDMKGKYIGVNSAFLEFHKLTKKEVIGKGVYEIFDHTFAEKYDQKDRKLIKSGKNQKYQIKILNGKKEERKLELYKSIYNGSDNKPAGILGVFIDITDQEKMTSELQYMKERLELTLRGGRLAWWDWNYKTGVLDFNDKKTEMLGYEKDEIQPSVEGFMSLLHKDDYEKAMEAMRRHLNGESPFYETDYRIRKKNGEYIRIYDRGMIVERDEEGNPLRIAGIVYDMCFGQEQD